MQNYGFRFFSGLVVSESGLIDYCLGVMSCPVVVDRFRVRTNQSHAADKRSIRPIQWCSSADRSRMDSDGTARCVGGRRMQFVAVRQRRYMH